MIRCDISVSVPKKVQEEEESLSRSHRPDITADAADAATRQKFSIPEIPST